MNPHAKPLSTPTTTAVPSEISDAEPTPGYLHTDLHIDDSKIKNSTLLNAALKTFADSDARRGTPFGRFASDLAAIVPENLSLSIREFHDLTLGFIKNLAQRRAQAGSAITPIGKTIYRAGEIRDFVVNLPLLLTEIGYSEQDCESIEPLVQADLSEVGTVLGEASDSPNFNEDKAWSARLAQLSITVSSRERKEGSSQLDITDRAEIREIKRRLRSLNEFLADSNQNEVIFGRQLERFLVTGAGLSARNICGQAVDLLQKFYAVSPQAPFPKSDSRAEAVGLAAAAYKSLMQRLPAILAAVGFDGTKYPRILLPSTAMNLFSEQGRDWFPFGFTKISEIQPKKRAAAGTQATAAAAPELPQEPEIIESGQSAAVKALLEIENGDQDGSEVDLELEEAWSAESGERKRTKAAQEPEARKGVSKRRDGPSRDALASETVHNKNCGTLIEVLNERSERMAYAKPSTSRTQKIERLCKSFQENVTGVYKRFDFNDEALPGPCHSLDWIEIDRADKAISKYWSFLQSRLQADLNPHAKVLSDCFDNLLEILRSPSGSYFTGEILKLVTGLARSIR